MSPTVHWRGLREAWGSWNTTASTGAGVAWASSERNTSAPSEHDGGRRSGSIRRRISRPVLALAETRLADQRPCSLAGGIVKLDRRPP